MLVYIKLFINQFWIKDRLIKFGGYSNHVCGRGAWFRSSLKYVSYGALPLEIEFVLLIGPKCVEPETETLFIGEPSNLKIVQWDCTSLGEWVALMRKTQRKTSARV